MATKKDNWSKWSYYDHVLVSNVPSQEKLLQTQFSVLKGSKDNSVRRKFRIAPCYQRKKGNKNEREVGTYFEVDFGTPNQNFTKVFQFCKGLIADCLLLLYKADKQTAGIKFRVQQLKTAYDDWLREKEKEIDEVKNKFENGETLILNRKRKRIETRKTTASKVQNNGVHGRGRGAIHNANGEEDASNEVETLTLNGKRGCRESGKSTAAKLSLK